MAVMGVGEVRVGVSQGLVAMTMGVADSGGHPGVVSVLVMLVVKVFVLVLHGLMGMQVIVPFRQMKPDAKRHQ